MNGLPPNGPVVQVRHDGDGTAPQAIANTGTIATDLTVTVLGVPAADEPAGGQGYTIAREYFTMEGKRGVARQGAKVQAPRLVTVLTIRPQGRQEGAPDGH